MIFVVGRAVFFFSFYAKNFIRANSRQRCLFGIGKNEESSSFEYTVDKAEKVEKRLNTITSR
jgi:hypothetical protein